jgi:hypothetical protein
MTICVAGPAAVRSRNAITDAIVFIIFKFSVCGKDAASGRIP